MILKPSGAFPFKLKSIRTLLLMALFCIASLLHAQQFHVLKVNPLSLFTGTGNIQFEYSMAKRVSILLGGYYGGFSQATTANAEEKIKYRWAGITPEVRFFPGFQEKEAPVGFYLGAHMRLRRVKTTWRGNTYDPDVDSALMARNEQIMPGIGLGGVLGYQIVIKERLALDMFAGPQFMVGSPRYSATCPTCNRNERNDYPEGPDFSGLEIRAGVGIGYAFSRP